MHVGTLRTLKFFISPPTQSIGQMKHLNFQQPIRTLSCFSFLFEIPFAHLFTLLYWAYLTCFSRISITLNFLKPHCVHGTIFHVATHPVRVIRESYSRNRLHFQVKKFNIGLSEISPFFHTFFDHPDPDPDPDLHLDQKNREKTINKNRIVQC